ncbi:MAG: hypothetical protein JWR89_4757 [Tardiphaga sp.]|uniref:tyrosine-type recombinase/integrase n=1 Tax=Tardiphaga sp. TaxID=1926292 RepID=UPI0026262D3E|nr:tyrosine-type recombinase/integrase [Tardiphaga sp.]MDB5504855.1 hypothetical protein [Tardiphaga sp.]
MTEFTDTIAGREIVVWPGNAQESPRSIETPLQPSIQPTLSGLIFAYQHDPLSRFHKLRYAIRQNHAALLRRVDERHGGTALADISGRTLTQWHTDWQGDGKVAMAHAFISQLRTLFGFGFALLSCGECRRLSATLGEAAMRFPMAPAREVRLTADQANGVRHWAHAIGWHSIALAQAFQFELMLRQKDCVGEWVPESEPGESIIRWRGQKWLRGMWWREIDENLIFRHVTSKRLKPVAVDLKLSPMVMDEITNHIEPGQIHPRDPVICCEATGMPYSAAEFRRKWRIVADYARIPKNVRNMDSRSGAITESFEAGIPGEAIQKMATHSDIAMTQRYNRGDYQNTAAKVQAARTAHRGAETVMDAERGTPPAGVA